MAKLPITAQEAVRFVSQGFSQSQLEFGGSSFTVRVVTVFLVVAVLLVTVQR